MATLAKNFGVAASKQIRRYPSGSAGSEGCTKDQHMLVGPTGGGTTQLRHRSLLRFTYNWTDVKAVVKAEMALRIDTSSTHFSAIAGSKPKIRVNVLSKPFHEGNNTEDDWSADEYEYPSSVGGALYTVDAITDEAFIFIDITPLAKYFSPTGVAQPDGTMGYGWLNYGFVVRAQAADENISGERIIFHSRWAPTTSSRPYIRLTYDSKNLPPTAPTLSNPPTTASFGDSFEGLHNDPDGDPMASRIIKVWAVPAGATPVWTLDANLQAASSSESQTGVFSVPLSLAAARLSSRTAYKWQAATVDSSGSEGAYSALRDLLIASSIPVVVAKTQPPIAAMADATFGGAYSDPESDPLSGFQMQFQPVSAHTDAAFGNPSAFVWDTGEDTASADEVTRRVVNRPYGGNPLAVGTYTYRIRVRDTAGGWSAWDYADFQLTTAFDPGLGNVDLTTQIARDAPVRIALYSVFTTIAHTTRAAGRGLGYLIGYIDDPMDLGASTYLNGGGELYFTLPALHPYCPEIEPHQVHYAVEQWYGDRYRSLFNGLITDFDADADSVVFYGADYPGLLQTAVDERFTEGTEKEAPAGSHYTNRSIDFVIKDQLAYHKALPDSPVGFITVPASPASFQPVPEHVTIYSTYAEALPFISGLIDSHKQGTGRECRFYARPTNATYTAWEWALIDNWGKDRPNIRLEYGGLLNDFRVVALGDFGTRVLGVGQKRGEVTVYRKVGLGLPETTFGRVAKTRFYADITDKADLQRRVNEDSAQLAKIGKRMALAIRADMLTPFDGWDVGDSIVVDIDRGVVDSERYGSQGLWTILGVEWRYFPDGHTDLTLTVLPKKAVGDPPTDLIGSVNPGVPKEWQTGYGVPTTYGEPPSNTPEPLVFSAVMEPSLHFEVTPYALPLSTDEVNAANYQDLNTGCIYELDQEWYTDPPTNSIPNPHYNVYTEVYCPDTSGGGGGGTADTTPPPIPVIKSLEPLEATQQDDGTTVSGLKGVLGYAGGGSPTPENIPYNDSTFTHYGIAIADYTGYGGVPCHVYNNSLPVAVEFDIDGPVDLVFHTFGGYAQLIVDGVDIAFLIGPSVGTPGTMKDTAYSLAGAGTHHLKFASTGAGIGSANFAFAGMTATSAAPPPAFNDLAEYIVQSTRYTIDGEPEWSNATEWRTISEDTTGTADTTIVQPNVLAGETYYWRASAVDKYGNRQLGWSLVEHVEAASDLVPPPRPTGIVIVPGMNVIGMRWSPVLAEDFDHTEVQIRKAYRAALPADPAHVPPVVGYPERLVGEWVSVTTGGTLVVLTGLQNSDPVLDPVTYELRLRSVDTSDNVMLASGAPAKASDVPSVGWVDHVGDDPAAALLTASPTALPGSALVWNEAIIEDVFAGTLNADWIVAGTLRVGNPPDDLPPTPTPGPTFIEVYDVDGNLSGKWSTDGITLLDPANGEYKMVLDETGLVIWAGVGTSSVYKAVTLNPLGIDAASITFGSARGGHNLVPNSSFELGAFPPPAPASAAPQWDVAADWNAANSRQGADINVTTGASALTMTSVT